MELLYILRPMYVMENLCFAIFINELRVYLGYLGKQYDEYGFLNICLVSCIF